MRFDARGTDASATPEGWLTCTGCDRRFPIRASIPHMYVPDDEAIRCSGEQRFPQFIVTSQTLEERLEGLRPPRSGAFRRSRLLTRAAMPVAWLLLLAGVALTVINRAAHAISGWTLDLAVLMIAASGAIFVVDYWRHRRSAKIQYVESLRMLHALARSSFLSEHDIRASIRDDEARYRADFEKHRALVKRKTDAIASVIDRHSPEGTLVLNVGCGGALHADSSRLYVDGQRRMVGVDVSEEYLTEFARIHDSEAILANALALPLADATFDLVAYTDIIEHLHHPFLGLREAHRVSREQGGIVLTTNNRCALCARCINPLVFLERVVSLYCDSVLPERVLSDRWMDFEFYHTEFSRSEITTLLTAAGFEIQELRTHFPVRRRLGRAFRKLPVLRFMGREFLIAARKT